MVSNKKSPSASRTFFTNYFNHSIGCSKPVRFSEALPSSDAFIIKNNDI